MIIEVDVGGWMSTEVDRRVLSSMINRTADLVASKGSNATAGREGRNSDEILWERERGWEY